MVKDATKQVGSTSKNGASQPYVALEFNKEGTERFAEATSNNIGKQIYIIMDNEVISAPTVQTAITNGQAMITGSFTAEGAEQLASPIRAGSLPFNLNVIQMKNVGARLGADALSTGIKAGIIGIALVLIYMLFAYKLLGFAADWALVIYIGLELVALSLFHVTLTLPGIAGIVLSVGMAVDANIVIFERVKEELVLGKSLRNALKAGFKRATPAILDGNVTTLIAAAVLTVAQIAVVHSVRGRQGKAKNTGKKAEARFSSNAFLMMTVTPILMAVLTAVVLLAPTHMIVVMGVAAAYLFVTAVYYTVKLM